jgi:DNA invertase Pin-like site-specific DNA recombinase
MTDASRRKFGVVVVWKFDRFARSVSHLLRALEEFKALGVEFVSLTESVDTSTPMGKMIFTVLGAVAELERNLIVERVRAGVQRARSQGRIAGRKVPKIDIEVVRTRIAFGESQRQIAKSLGVSPALITKRLKGAR